MRTPANLDHMSKTKRHSCNQNFLLLSDSFGLKSKKVIHADAEFKAENFARNYRPYIAALGCCMQVEFDVG